MSLAEDKIQNISYWKERVDLAAAFRWAARFDLHEGVANHFSFSINDDGSKFLMNPNQVHFSRIKASELIVVDANDPDTLNLPGAPDPTAWGLHGSIHRNCLHARCAMHVHSTYATVIACLKNSSLPPIDQNCAIFFNRYVIDENYGGLAFEEEGKRCADLLSDPKKHTFIMGNHGILMFGQNVAETFNRLFYFERAAKIYVQALQTGKTLSILDDDIAEKTAQELENEELPNPAGTAFLREIKLILDQEKSDYSQ